MIQKILLIALSAVACTVFGAGPAAACNSCGCSLARSGGPSKSAAEEQQPWFVDFMTEQQNWNKMTAREAHLLHHDGHHVHNKTHEEFYHLGLGRRVAEDWTFRAEIPYVVRHSIEIDDHRRLGEKEVSEGIGDLKLTAVWRFVQSATDHFGVLGGVKLPTGSTTELNSVGTRFEPELQPGSGSADGMAGVVYGITTGAWTIEGNAIYNFRTEGDQNFKYGSGFASYAAVHTPIGPRDGDWAARVGADMNFQADARDREQGALMPDSGGTTLLVGPAVSIGTSGGWELIGNILFPAVQNLGGVHQELVFVWNAGGKFTW